MEIGTLGSLRASSSAAPAARPAANAPASGTAGDSYARAAAAINVLTFNTASEATNFKPGAATTHFWQVMKQAGVEDVHPEDNTSGGQDIDHVLQSGFNVVGDEAYNGNKLTIPGRANADQVADHYAHGVSLEIPDA